MRAMTAVTHGTRVPSRSLLGKVAGSIGRTARGRHRVAVVAAAVREHVVTVAAFAAIDYGAFMASHVAGWVVLGVSLLVWFACAVLLRQFDWTPLSALVLNAAVYAVTIPLSWRYRSSAPPRKFLRTRYDIPLRALAAATVVVVVTSASHSIGSFASGMFALFPIVFCSSIVILHPRVGGKATASVMAHAQVALIGLTLAFMAVHYLAEPLGSWWALLIGLGISIAWSGMLMAMRSKRMARIFRRD